MTHYMFMEMNVHPLKSNMIEFIHVLTGQLLRFFPSFSEVFIKVTPYLRLAHSL